MLVAGIGASVVVAVIAVVGAFAWFAWDYATAVPRVDDDPMLSSAPAGTSRVSSMQGEDLDSPVRFAGTVLRPGTSQSSQDVVEALAESATEAGWVPVPATGYEATLREGWLCFVRVEDGVPQRVLDIGPYDGAAPGGLPADVALVVSAWGEDWFGPGALDAPCGTTGIFNGDWYPYAP
jgi:hypothetical protein